MIVASSSAFERALTKVVNDPNGMHALGDAIGASVVLDRIVTLQTEYGEDRYRPSVLLRRAVKQKRSLLA